MVWFFDLVAVILTGLFVWGLVAPRSQWWALTSWAIADPYKHEPGAGAYNLRRLASGVGLLGLVSVFLISTAPLLVSARSAGPPSAVEQMWGSPDPQVVNRVATARTEPPTTLPEVPILGYQAFEESSTPPYLTPLKTYTLLGSSEISGLIGSDPDVGFSAVDTAHLVINVRGPILCIPRAVVVIETETTVQIAAYYGLPNSADGSAVDHLAGCPADSYLTASLLLPIRLSAPVGERELQALDGTPLTAVPLVEPED